MKTFDEPATVGNNWSCGGEEDDDDQYTGGVPKAPSPRHFNLAVNRHVFDTVPLTLLRGLPLPHQ